MRANVCSTAPAALLAAALLAAVLAGSAGAETRTSSALLSLAPGESTTVALEENVTTGYSWRYDPARSTDPDCVTIADLGHERRGGEPAVGAPGLHRWQLTAVSRGRAAIRFVYQRPWEPEPAREHTVAIEVR